MYPFVIRSYSIYFSVPLLLLSLLLLILSYTHCEADGGKRTHDGAVERNRSSEEHLSKKKRILNSIEFSTESDGQTVVLEKIDEDLSVSFPTVSIETEPFLVSVKSDPDKNKVMIMVEGSNNNCRVRSVATALTQSDFLNDDDCFQIQVLEDGNKILINKKNKKKRSLELFSTNGEMSSLYYISDHSDISESACPSPREGEVIACEAHSKKNDLNGSVESFTCRYSDEAEDEDFDSSAYLPDFDVLDDSAPRKQCETCGKAFKWDQQLRSHKKTHQKGWQGWKCETCGETFNHQPSLSSHKKTHQEGWQGWKCETCGETFNHQPSLFRHKKTHQEGWQGWKCETCGKTFKWDQQLSSHKKTHQKGWQGWKCETCGKTFNGERQLFRHKKTHQKGWQGWKCETCGKTFNGERQLFRHKKTHQKGWQGWKCETCGETFNSQPSLSRHKKKH